jgi:hypothetical protein
MNHQPQRLIVTQDAAGWVVRGEGLNFFCATSDKSSALFVAHRTRNDWYPRARVVVREVSK